MDLEAPHDDVLTQKNQANAVFLRHGYGLARGPGGRRFVRLGFDLFVFLLFPGSGGMIFEPIAPAGDGNCLSMVQEAIQDRSHEMGSLLSSSLSPLATN